MGRNWAITIGINGYRNLQALNYAKRDAEAMRDFCLREAGFEGVYHFTEDAPPIVPPSGSEMDSSPTFTALWSFLLRRFERPFLRAGDNLWLFFAGHGIRHEERDYLMPLDGDPRDVERTAIPLHYITERLRQSGADNIVLFVDACRSGVGRRDGLGVGQEPPQGVITFFSCSPYEASYEIEPLQHGSFTHVLLESLRLQGEGNCATVERLNHRLSYRVREVNRHFKMPDQSPYSYVEPATKYHWLLLPRLANVADVMALKNDALMAEVRQDGVMARQYWVRVLAVSPADPEAIEAIERVVRLQGGMLPSATDQTTTSQDIATGHFTGDGQRGSEIDVTIVELQHASEVAKSHLKSTDLKPIGLSLPAHKPFPIQSYIEEQNLYGIFDLVNESIEDWLKSHYVNSLVERKADFNSYLLVDIVVHSNEPLIRTGYEVGYLYTSNQLKVLDLILRKKFEALGYALCVKNIHKTCLIVVVDEYVEFYYLKIARDIGKYILQEQNYLVPNLDIVIGRIIWRDNPQEILETNSINRASFPFFEAIYQLSSANLESFLKSLKSLKLFVDN